MQGGSAGRVEVLGPLRLLVDGSAMEVPQGQVGVLLRTLLVRPGEPVSTDVLVERLWPGAEPGTGRRRLQLTASRLRARLPAGILVEWGHGGYRITSREQGIDRLAFEALVPQALRGDADAALSALALWKDEPYLGFEVTAELQHERRRLASLRARVEAVLAGHPTETAPSLLVRERPRSRSAVIPRTRMLGTLPHAGAARLVGLTAPSGYGKTVVLGQWARRERCPVAWVSLTSRDDTVTAFHTAVLEASRDAFGLIHTPSAIHPDEESHPIVGLVNRLDQRAGRGAIVFDDLQAITNPEVHAALWDLVRLCPQDLTVVVGSRRSLPFPTSRLATADKVMLAGPRDLAFTTDELEAVIDTTSGRGDAARPSASWLHSVTGGWPEPAVAVASMLAAGFDADRDEEIVSSLLERDLLDRVLGGVPADLVTFLERTAHLRELRPGLCEAVTGDRSSEAHLHVLARRHHLVLPGRSGYRHHRLLASLLGRRAERHAAAQVGERHRRAAQWYLDNGGADRALDHAAAASDTPLVARSLEAAIGHAAGTGDSDTLLRWTTTIALTDELDARGVETALLVSAFLPPHRRGMWELGRATGGSEQLARTTAAIDLVRRGHCRDALTTVAEARPLLDDATALTRQFADALLWLVDSEARLLLGDDTGTRSSVPRSADSGAWPWLTFWAYGMRAVVAGAAGDRGLARAMLEHARRRAGPLHPSWRRLERGYLAVAEALCDSSPSGSTEQRARALGAVATRANRAGDMPIGILAGYALHHAHRRRGDTQTATARLAEADDALGRVQDLPFLSHVRSRLVVTSGPTDTGQTAADLSSRERTVLRYLDSDLTLAQIADELFLSVHTIKAHTRAIYRKLGVSARAEAVAHRNPGWSAT